MEWLNIVRCGAVFPSLQGGITRVDTVVKPRYDTEKCWIPAFSGVVAWIKKPTRCHPRVGGDPEK